MKIINKEAIRKEKSKFDHSYTAFRIGPIKEGRKIGHAIMPAIRYLHSKGANQFEISIDDESHELSIFTPDIGLSKEELEKESESPIVKEVVRCLSTLV